MRPHALRSGFVLMALLSLTGLGAAQSNAAPPNPAEKTAEQVFKNIQVFHGKPANELRPTMSFIASSLGVRCSYCHAVPDFSSDAKPTKKRARQMVEMVYAINKSTFGGRNEVNCYTCHQGSTHPNGRISLASAENTAARAGRGEPAGGRAANAPKLPSAEEILAKYEAAIGGASALQAVHGETVTAQRVAFGRAAAETVTRAQGKVLLSEGAKSKSGFDGTDFWSWGPRGANRDLSSETITQLRTDLPLYPGAGLKAAGARVRGTEKVGDSNAYVVVARTPSGFASYDFDTETGLLLRYTTGAPTFLGTLPLQVSYSDYRSVGDVKLPFAITWTTNEDSWQRKVSAIELNPTVDAASFQAPANTPASAAGGAGGGRR